MLDGTELQQVRNTLYTELAAIEADAARHGSYTYLCVLAGEPVFSHFPVGPVLRTFKPRTGGTIT